MAFTQELPEWNAPGVEPSATQKQTGFQPGMKPPAQWFNWHLNWSYLALKELQEKAAEKTYVDSEIEELRVEVDEKLQNIELPDTDNWQKHKLTEDNGNVTRYLSGSVNNLVSPGFYYAGYPATDIPDLTAYYIEVFVDDSRNVFQRATEVGNSKTYVRQRWVSLTTWSPWVLQTPEENLWGAL